MALSIASVQSVVPSAMAPQASMLMMRLGKTGGLSRAILKGAVAPEGCPTPRRARITAGCCCLRRATPLRTGTPRAPPSVSSIKLIAASFWAIPRGHHSTVPRPHGLQSPEDDVRRNPDANTVSAASAIKTRNLLLSVHTAAIAASPWLARVHLSIRYGGDFSAH